MTNTPEKSPFPVRRDSQTSRIARFLEDKLFDLATHQAMAETGTMPREMQEYYTSAMDMDTNEAALLGLRPTIRKIAYSKALEIYLSILGDNAPEQMGLHVSGDLVKVWAEVDEDNEDYIRTLLLAGSRASFECAYLGITFETMYVGRNEGYTMPSWYKMLELADTSTK